MCAGFSTTKLLLVFLFLSLLHIWKTITVYSLHLENRFTSERWSICRNYLELFCLGYFFNSSLIYLHIYVIIYFIGTNGYLFYIFTYKFVILYFVAQFFPVLSIGNSLISCSILLAGFKHTYILQITESQRSF